MKGKKFTASIKFGETTKTCDVRILDKVTVFDTYPTRKVTKYVVVDIENGSNTIGKICLISPEDLISE